MSTANFTAASAFASLRTADRIHVTGNVAAGKSTLSRALGGVLGLPVVHMDPMVWSPGWRKRHASERDALVTTATVEARWIIDGVSQHVRRACDALVFLDLPTWVAVRRALARALRLRWRSRPELGRGFPELKAVSPALRLAVRFNRRVRPGIVADLETVATVVHIRTVGELAAFLDECTLVPSRPTA